MSFSGRVDKQSHNGGLLVSFEGRPPRLGANIRITGGKILGKVETVIGPVDDGLIHLYPPIYYYLDYSYILMFPSLLYFLIVNVYYHPY